MRTFVLTLLASCLALSQLSAAPTAQQQANYDAACASVVAAVNAYRSSNGRAGLVPLVELCKTTREDAENQELGVGLAKAIYNRAWENGYEGTFLSPRSAFGYRGPVSAVALFQKMLADPTNQAAFLSSEASYIGVGLALKIAGASTEFRLRIILGKEVLGEPNGTVGLETGTGRGLLDLSLLREIQARAWSGNSINGFVRDPRVVVLTAVQEKAFGAALSAFARKYSVVRMRVGKSVRLRVPSAVAKFVRKFALKGKLPPGIRFDKRTNRFRGSAKRSGKFRVTLTGNLRGPVKGSDKLKPIRIQFAIGD